MDEPIAADASHPEFRFPAKILRGRTLPASVKTHRSRQ
jgi:hypothetical protein